MSTTAQTVLVVSAIVLTFGADALRLRRHVKRLRRQLDRPPSGSVD